ncbi:MAG: hypothetical protein E6J76_09885 [Deltaproteobacteria bacterium]|nr:MAG: hypothetical protein E6J76_09885 [Deltaproteobacteria bacterium]
MPAVARAAGPTIQFTLPALNATPSTFGTLPFPDDLYFDQGRPGDGDGTLLNSGATIGLAVDVFRNNTDAIEKALDLLDGFGTTSAIFFFFDGPITPTSLPTSPVLTPALTDSVFCANATTAVPVPVEVKFDVDTRIPNVLAILPLPGRPLAPGATYTCVVTTSVSGPGGAVQPSTDWTSVRDGASANSDADAIFDPVVSTLVGHGVPAASIASMTVFTTQSTTTDLLTIQSTVLPAQAVPTADFTSRPELVFSGSGRLDALLGARPHAHLAAVATGFYGSARFQTHDPGGDGPLADFPSISNPADCPTCERTDERFTRDGLGVPIVIDVAEIPFTVAIPSGTPPPGGWPVIIQQHGLGGQRDTVVLFSESDAAGGFASIGIDAAAHGYRYLDCTPSSTCQDTANNFGGTAVPDGFADGTLFGFDIGFLSTNLGFFQAFHNFLGVRDNFRQTYADLLSLVRLLHGHSIDSALHTTLNDSEIFYVGHSLGGLMGSGFVPIEPGVSGALLNATGGGLTNELFSNSSIGAGALPTVQNILGLDTAQVFDHFAFGTNLVQEILDPADAVNSASLLLSPAIGAPRNVIQVEDYGDQVVPNEANEALAAAAGLQIFDPFVQNLHQNPLLLPIANFATPRTVTANAAAGLATAALLQNGPATHASSVTSVPGTLTFVPEFARVDEFPQVFPTLVRGIRVPNAGIFPAVLAWFHDIAANGPPGTFAFSGDPDFNPVENTEALAGPSTQSFFTRTVDAGGALSATISETTPDVVVAFSSNLVDTRLTAGRSTLGTSALASDRDVPPGPASSVGSPGFLPFFVTLQREIPGSFSADVSIAYTTDELIVAEIAPGSADESALVVARFTPGTCTVGAASCSENADCGANGPCAGTGYVQLPTTVNTGGHTATATGVTSFSTFAVVHPDALAGGYEPPALLAGAGRVRVLGGGSATRDCRAQWVLINTTTDVGNQVCQDGDVSCDGDAVPDGACTFKLGVCFNADSPSCTADTTVSYELNRPTTSHGDALARSAASALLGALQGLGGTVGGTHQNVVTFTSPLMGIRCTSLADVRVATRGVRSGRSTIRGSARSGDGVLDSDRLRLRCDPAS